MPRAPRSALRTVAAATLAFLLGSTVGVSLGQTLPTLELQPGDQITIRAALPSATASPAPTAAPTAAPSATAAPTPAPTAVPTASPIAGDHNVSGIVIPAPFAGYERVDFTEFPNESRLGDGVHPDTLRHLKPRPDVDRDCTFRDSSGRGVYCAERTIEETGGLLRHWLHTENAGQSGIFHVPNGNINYVSGLMWTVPKQTEFVVSFVARLEDIPGRKVAFLRWCGPPVGASGYCEDNFPEAKLEAGPRGFAFHHHESRSTQNGWALETELDSFHLYQLHVKPGQFVDFYLDGRLVGHATQHVSRNASYYVFQAETYLKGQAIPVPHNEGWLEFDAYALDLPAD